MRGRCLCGAVGFEGEPKQFETHVCHCEMCRRWTGSALLAVAVLAETIRFEGAENIRRYRSSDQAERAWCDRCGSALYFRFTGPEHRVAAYEMMLGLFDEPDAFPMTKEIFVESKPLVYAFTGEHPRLTGAEALARPDMTDAGAE